MATINKMVPQNSLFNAESIDLFAIPKIPTGIKELDNFLIGGIPLGVVTVLIAYEGVGKSTLGLQFVAMAISREEPFTSLIYSDEMQAGHSLNILLHQLAGKSGLTMEKISKNNDFYRTLDEEAVQDAKQRFGSLVLEQKLNRNMSFKDYCQSMEEYAKQGVQLFVVDNLLTLTNRFATDSSFSGINKFEKQEIIAIFLEHFAKEFNVAVLLIAHKRKQGYDLSANLNDEISGASAIKDCAGLVLHYDEAKGNVSYHRTIRVTKNRFFRKHSGKETIKIKFCDKTKRSYSVDDEEFLDKSFI